MNVSNLLLWLAGIAIAIDFIIYLFSHKYREYGGHIIGAMAYLVLLADLTYSIYLGESGYDNVQQLLPGTLVVGAFLSIEYTVSTYRHIRMHEKGLALLLNENTLEEQVKQQNAKIQKLEKQNEQLIENLQKQAEKQRELLEQRNLRIIANEEYEERINDDFETKDTREAFQLYTLLIHGYECERGPKFERQLHHICEKICHHLDEKEIKALLQIDLENSRKAGEFFDAI